MSRKTVVLVWLFAWGSAVMVQAGRTTCPWADRIGSDGLFYLHCASRATHCTCPV